MNTTKFVFNPFTSNFDAVTSTIDLTSDVTGILPVPNGGTGLATLTAHDVLVGNGAGNVTLISPSTAGFVLTSNGVGSDPTFQAAGSGSGITSLTGDVTATGPGAAAASLVATSNSTLTTLSALSLLTSQLTGVLTEANGGTHQSTYTTGDILYASATNTLSKLPIGTSAQNLIVQSGIPAWGGVTYAVSSSCNNFATTSSSYVNVTNLSVTLNASGRPIIIMCIADGSGTPANWTAQNTGAIALMDVAILRDGTIISESELGLEGTIAALGGFNFEAAPGSVTHFDASPSIASHTYTVQIKVNSSAQAQANMMKLVAYEV